jgi:putative membrane protein
MKNIIIRIVIFIGAVYLASRIVSGVSFSGWQSLVLMGVVLTVAHGIIKPIIKIITLPITILTLGLFTLVINAALFWFAGSIISGFIVSTFVAAFWGSVVVSIVSGILSTFIDKDED